MMLTFPLSKYPPPKKISRLPLPLSFCDGGPRLLKSLGPRRDSWKQTQPQNKSHCTEAFTTSKHTCYYEDTLTFFSQVDNTYILVDYSKIQSPLKGYFSSFQLLYPLTPYFTDCFQGFLLFPQLLLLLTSFLPSNITHLILAFLTKFILSILHQ